MARAGTPRLSGRRSAAAVLVALAGLARGVSAQGAPAVSGAVRDSATAEPVSMAELTLRDASGARLASTRSAPDGAYVLRARRPGQYRSRYVTSATHGVSWARWRWARTGWSWTCW